MSAIVIASLLQSIKPAPAQSAGRIVIFPLFSPAPQRPEYVALAGALAQKQVEITEVDQGGSVPELAVINHGGTAVLLLDGEELAGAKQNRVLNTTILIAALSKTLIPVSCSEQGRWHYTSASFAPSGNVMSPSARKKKNSSVTISLESAGSYHSNQGEVWDEIAALHLKSGTSHLSETGAMSDVFAARQKELDELAAAFPLTGGQTGILVLRDGRVEGCDVISRPEVYGQIHERLVRSYAMESLVEQPTQDGTTATEARATAEAFLRTAAAVDSTPHKSPGLGEDHRLAGSGLAGSALVVEGQVVHLALFPTPGPEEEKGNSLASVRRRRRYRGI